MASAELEELETDFAAALAGPIGDGVAGAVATTVAQDRDPCYLSSLSFLPINF